MKRYLVLATLLCGTAQAQVWNSNTVSWESPTTCSTGEPVSACPVTGYRVERANSPTGAFASVATVTSTSYVHANVTAGQNCYKVFAIASNGTSLASNTACRTNTAPAGPPNPPTNVQVTVTVAVVVHPDITATPVVRVMQPTKSKPKLHAGEVFGLVPLGRQCEGPVLFDFRGKEFRRVDVKPKELWGSDDNTNLAAACAKRG